MKVLLKKASKYFFAGCLGGIVVNVINLFLNLVNIPLFIGVDLSQDFSLVFLVSDILWSGLWGLLFFIPLLNDLIFVKGVLLSLFISLFELFVALPKINGIDSLNHELNVIYPLYIVLLNAVWGLVAASFIRYVEQNDFLE